MNAPDTAEVLLTAEDFSQWAEAAIDTEDEAAAWQYLAGWCDAHGYARLPIPASI